MRSTILIAEGEIIDMMGGKDNGFSNGLIFIFLVIYVVRTSLAATIICSDHESGTTLVS